MFNQFRVQTTAEEGLAANGAYLQQRKEVVDSLMAAMREHKKICDELSGKRTELVPLEVAKIYKGTGTPEYYKLFCEIQILEHRAKDREIQINLYSPLLDKLTLQMEELSLSSKKAVKPEAGTESPRLGGHLT